jgi:cephalosporin-C deacetylase-like acetyl esterase
VFYTSEIYGNEKVRIHGYLYYINTKEKLPAIIILHGFAGSAEDTRFYAMNLASKGYVALAIDSPGQGLSTGPKNNQRNFANITDGPYYTYLYRNVVAVVRGISLLSSLNFVDSSKIGVSGASQGGVTTFLVSALDKRVKLSIPIIASGGFDEAARKGSAVHAIVPKELTANSKEAILLIKHFDPFGYIDKINSPLLMLIGTNDEFFLLEPANKTFSMVSSNIKFINLIPNTGHTFTDDWFYSSLRFADWIFKGKEPLPEIELKIVQVSPFQAKIVVLTKSNNVALHVKGGFPWSLWKTLDMKFKGYDEKVKLNTFEATITLSLFEKKVFASAVEDEKFVCSTQVFSISPSFLLQSLSLAIIFSVICMLFYKLAKLNKLRKVSKEHAFLILCSVIFTLSSFLPFIEIVQRTKVTIWDIVSTYIIKVPTMLILFLFILLVLVPLTTIISKRLGIVISAITLTILWLTYFYIEAIFSRFAFIVPSSSLILTTSSFIIMLIKIIKKP